VAKDTGKRVVGVLLGEHNKGQLDVTNSYAVPFEEDERDPSVWFLDHSYHESMFSMFKRINGSRFRFLLHFVLSLSSTASLPAYSCFRASPDRLTAKEQVVGWYSTGPKLREGDMSINDLFTAYCETPVLVIVQVSTETSGLPTSAYIATEEVKEGASQQAQKSFSHVPCEVGAHESEEVGVEHLLRDVRGNAPTDLGVRVANKMSSLRGLEMRLKEVASYLDKVLAGELPPNQEVLAYLQNAFSLLPSLEARSLSGAFASRTNDNMLSIYLASLVRSVIALHDLISNQQQQAASENQRQEKKHQLQQHEGEQPQSNGDAGGG
jgi:26S proteasome regulatory subunit N8